MVLKQKKLGASGYFVNFVARPDFWLATCRQVMRQTTRNNSIKITPMKKLLTALSVALLIPFFSMSQANEKLQQALSQDEIDAIAAQGENEIAFWNYYANRAATVQTMTGDLSSMPEISELNSLRKNQNIPEVNAGNFNANAFNPMAYNLDIDNQVYYYRVGNTDQVVQIMSEQRIRHLFNNGY
ncbi:MAG: hypothetical protein EA392_04100 [Cryomorphaceae bacterium]|nr:MAG: hypothetical protein EA392_04100 [Cryomorphaceae bacterium]